MRKLKVWVIEGVLCDYSAGMVVVAAYSKKQALELLRQEIGEYHLAHRKGEPWKFDNEPLVLITKPSVYSVRGYGS